MTASWSWTLNRTLADSLVGYDIRRAQNKEGLDWLRSTNHPPFAR